LSASKEAHYRAQSLRPGTVRARRVARFVEPLVQKLKALKDLVNLESINE
jgi:hypothetical protein